MGLISVSIPRFIDEVVPQETLEALAAIYPFS
jgi:hypothetical protein